MELIDKRIRKRLPYVKLYLDEFLELDAALREHGELIEEIKTADYQLISVPELSQIPAKRISQLHIKTTNLSFEFESKRSTITASANTAKMQGLVGHVETILLKGKRSIASAILNETAAGVAALLLLVSLGLGVGLSSFVPPVYPAVLALLSFGYIALNWRDRTVIIPRLKADRPGFWQRNRDQLITNLMFTALGVIITLVVQWIMDHFTNR